MDSLGDLKQPEIEIKEGVPSAEPLASENEAERGLDSIQRQYERLRSHINLLPLCQRSVSSRSASLTEIEHQIEQQLEPLHHELAAACRKATRVPAKSLQDLAVKAGMLLHYSDPKDNSLPNQLSLSLCQDVILLSTQARRVMLQRRFR